MSDTDTSRDSRIHGRLTHRLYGVRQAAVDVAVFEKAVTEQKAKQQAELDAMNAELRAAKQLVEETTFRLEETLVAAQEAAHDAANALREAVEAEATAASEQTALALEEQQLALRTAASQALVRALPDSFAFACLLVQAAHVHQNRQSSGTNAALV